MAQIFIEFILRNSEVHMTISSRCVTKNHWVEGTFFVDGINVPVV